MTKGVVFDAASAQRIADVVDVVERRNLSVPRQRRDARPFSPSYMVRISANMAYNTTALVDTLQGPLGNESANSTFRLSCYNQLYRQLWAGAKAIVDWTIVEGSGGAWRIVWSDSAARVRGVAAAQINGNAGGTINTVVPIDGRVAPATISAQNMATYFTIPAGAKVWAEWCQQTGQWEIYASDCPAP